MSEEPRIRDFRPEDLDAVHEIERRSFPDPWPRPLFRALHGSPGVHFLVATLGGRVVGYALGRVERLPEGRVGHILNIAVSPEHRHSGIGTRLMKALEALLEGDDVGLVRLEVRTSNITAQRFYRRLGYRERGRMALYYGDEDALIMEKRLGRIRAAGG